MLPAENPGDTQHIIAHRIRCVRQARNEENLPPYSPATIVSLIARSEHVPESLIWDNSALQKGDM